MREDENFAFTPLHIDEKYQSWGRFDVVIQKFQALLPIAHEEIGQKKVWEMRQWTTKGHIKVIDEPKNSLVLQNRLLFLRNLQSAIEHMHTKAPAHPVYARLRCPKFFDFKVPEQGGGNAETLDLVK